MSFSMSQSGSKRVVRSLERLKASAPRLVRLTAKEDNRRHALTYRRRRLPRDTGRLADSLTFESHPDREVRVTRRGIVIGTNVPYAKYQRSRIRPMTRDELVNIFLEPIQELLQELLAGRG